MPSFNMNECVDALIESVKNQAEGMVFETKEKKKKTPSVKQTRMHLNKNP